MTTTTTTTIWQSNMNDCFIDIIYQLDMQHRRKYFLNYDVDTTATATATTSSSSKEEEDKKDLEKIIHFFSQGIVISKEITNNSKRIYRYQSHVDFINDYFTMINKQMIKSEFNYVIPSLHEMILNIPGLSSKLIIDIDFKPKSLNDMKEISSILFRGEIQFQSQYELMSDEKTNDYSSNRHNATSPNKDDGTMISFNRKILFNFIIKNIVKLLKKIISVKTKNNTTSNRYDEIPTYFVNYINRFDKKSNWTNPYSLDDLLSSLMIIFSASNTKKKSFHIYLPRILADMKIDMVMFNKCLSIMCYLDNPFLFFGIPYDSIHPKSRKTEEFIKNNEGKNDFHRKLWEYYCVYGGGSEKKKKTSSSTTEFNIDDEYSSIPSPSSSLNDDAKALLNKICTTYSIVDMGPYTSMRMQGSSKLYQFRPMKLMFPSVLPNHIEMNNSKSTPQQDDILRKRLDFIRSSDKSFLFDILNNKEDNESFQKFVTRQTLIHSNESIIDQNTDGKKDDDDKNTCINRKISSWNENYDKLHLCKIQMDRCQKNIQTNEYEFLCNDEKEYNFKLHLNHNDMLKIDNELTSIVGNDIIRQLPLNCLSSINRLKPSNVLHMLNIESETFSVFSDYNENSDTKTTITGLSDYYDIDSDEEKEQQQCRHRLDEMNQYDIDYNVEDEDVDKEEADSMMPPPKSSSSSDKRTMNTEKKYIVSGGGSLIKSSLANNTSFDFKGVVGQKHTSGLTTTKEDQKKSSLINMKRRQDEDNRFLYNELKLSQINPKNMKNKKISSTEPKKTNEALYRPKNIVGGSDSGGEFNNELRCDTLVSYNHVNGGATDYLFKCIGASLQRLFYPLKWPIKQIYRDNKANVINLSIKRIVTNTKPKEVYYNGNIDIIIYTNGYLPCPWKYIGLSCDNRDITNLKPESKFSEIEKNDILDRQNKKDYCHGGVNQLYISITIPVDQRKTGCKFIAHCYHTECTKTEDLNKNISDINKKHKFDQSKDKEPLKYMNPNNMYPVPFDHDVGQKLKEIFFDQKLKSINLSTNNFL